MNCLLKFSEIEKKLRLSRETTSPAVLKKLSLEEFVWIIHHVSLNEKTPASVFKKLIKHDSSLIRANLLFNKSISIKLIEEMLFHEKDDYVLSKARTASSEIVEVLERVKGA